MGTGPPSEYPPVLGATVPRRPLLTVSNARTDESSETGSRAVLALGDMQRC